METRYPSKLIRYDLLVVLVGLSCSLAAEQIATVHHSSGVLNHIPQVISTSAFMLNALNFLHGKTVLLEDDSYNRVLVNVPRLALWDFVLNVLIVLIFLFLALFLDSTWFIIVGNIALRIIDAYFVQMVRSITIDPAVRRSQAVWYYIDILIVVVFALIAILYIHPQILDYIYFVTWLVPIIYLTTVVIDIMVDYKLNHELYFSTPGTWDKIAEFWDYVQGHRGDIYRKWVIVPKIRNLKLIRDGCHILDLGCGNGCLARVMCEMAKEVTVLGIDRSATMIERAEERESDGEAKSRTNVTYRIQDFDKLSNSLGQEFDIIVACFSLQDCENLHNAFSFVDRHLKYNGKLLVIFENRNAFAISASHFTTARVPLEAQFNNHPYNGQKWLLSWSLQSMRLARVPDTTSKRFRRLLEENYQSMGDNEKIYSTITRYWSPEFYQKVAAEHGLEMVVKGPDEIVPEESKETMPVIIRKYQERAKMSYIVFGRKEAASR